MYYTNHDKDGDADRPNRECETMNFNPFTLSRLPTILYGAGRIDELPALLAGYQARVLVVTGARSFRASKQWERLISELGRRDIAWESL